MFIYYYITILSMQRVTKSIKIDPSLWKEVQHRCIDDGIDYSDFVENALKEALKNKKTMR